MTDMRQAYESAFLGRCLDLIALGYRRLAIRELAHDDEPSITGKLCDAMEAALDAPDRPSWATQLTTVDEQPESVRGKIAIQNEPSKFLATTPVQFNDKGFGVSGPFFDSSHERNDIHTKIRVTHVLLLCH